MIEQQQNEPVYVSRNKVDAADKPYKAAQKIENLLEIYTVLVRGGLNSKQTNFSDMLADMMHYADSQDFDFLDALQQAELNYAEEVTL